MDDRLPAQMMAEFVGTFLLVLLGCGSIAVSVYTESYALWPVAMMFGIGAALGIYASARISGGHINPVVTLTVATFDVFPWSRVAPFILAQCAGAFCAALLLYYLYADVIAAFEASEGLVRGKPGSQMSAMIFTTYAPNPAIIGTDPEALAQVGYLKWAIAEIFVTFILVFGVLFTTDQNNHLAPPAGLFPLVIGLLVAVLIAFEAPLTMTSMNPARDLGPRFVVWLFGWGEIAMPGPRGGFWIASAAPIVGGLLAGLFYTTVYASALALPKASTAPK